ncbi:unnamed protein product, partial [Callosobruchus maculatus]
NEISIIGFDKLKEIHFGADRSSGSESGENDVLDDEYYKNQPPAHSYDFIKHHVVKVNQRPRIQQIRKHYNRSNEFRRRAKPRPDQVVQRDSTVPFGHHALPAPIKELGSSSSSSSNHISNWIINSSIHQEALGSVIGNTPQRVFPIHSQVFNRSDFITEDRHFSDAINKNALSPTSGPSSRAISPPSNAIRPVLYNFEKPPSSYNHSTHFSNKNVIGANDGHSRIRHSSQSGGFAENEVVHNSYLPNHLAKMTDLKGSLPAPSSVKQQILSVDQMLGTYGQIGMDSNNIIQSNPNTQRQLPLEQCHTSGGNHSISKRLSDDLFSGQKEQKLVKKVTTSNLSESRKAATLASDEICKKTTKDVVQDATKSRKGSSTSTTKAHGHVGNNSCSETILEQPPSTHTQNDSVKKFVPKAFPRKVRTIEYGEVCRETVPVGRENKREEPAKAPTQTNESTQTGIISWLRRILCCARDTSYEAM